MNSNETAKALAQKMVEQEMQNLQEQRPPTSQQQAQPQPSLPEEIYRLLLEVQTMHHKTLEAYRKDAQRIAKTSLDLQIIDEQMLATTQLLNEIQEKAKQVGEQNSIGSRWVIRLYLISISSSVLSALMTLLIVWIRRH